VIVTGWRVVSSRFASSAFDGEGARRYGGRWNSEGIPVVYLAEAVSLALLEVLVHLEGQALLGTYAVYRVTWDAHLMREVNSADLPPQWKSYPPLPLTQKIGDTWFREGASPVLRVPSVVVDRESNFLLNPHHPQFKRITIGPQEKLKIDRRLARAFVPPVRAN
jgi:RES domain-containing protein